MSVEESEQKPCYRFRLILGREVAAVFQHSEFGARHICIQAVGIIHALPGVIRSPDEFDRQATEFVQPVPVLFMRRA